EGGSPLGTDPLESARRELLEEAGIIAQKWTFLAKIHTSNSVTDEYGLLYLAQELKFTEARPEETELLQIKKIPFSEALRMTLDGEITDSLSVAAILKLGIICGGDLRNFGK